MRPKQHCAEHLPNLTWTAQTAKRAATHAWTTHHVARRPTFLKFWIAPAESAWARGHRRPGGCSGRALK
eukprot:10564622-Alexandrium_andersonii.AAC.1